MSKIKTHSHAKSNPCHFRSLIAALLLSSFLAAAQARAEIVRTRIFRVESPSRFGEPYEALSTKDGRAYFITPDQPELAEDASAAARSGDAVKLLLDEDRIIAVQPLPAGENARYEDAFTSAFGSAPDRVAEAEEARETARPGLRLGFLLPEEDSFAPHAPRSWHEARALGFEPTVLASMPRAQELFGMERALRHGSQCYERAHVWARELEQKAGIRSMKAFMFFTSLFRQRYTTRFLFWNKPYKWWFHVAPFVYVADGAGAREVVLDREFLSRAVPMEDWTFEFIGRVRHDNREVPNPTRDEARCLEAERYSEYSEDPSPSRYCVLRKVPMYSFQPLDVEALERGRVLTDWRAGDLKRAYRDTAR